MKPTGIALTALTVLAAGCPNDPGSLSHPIIHPSSQASAPVAPDPAAPAGPGAASDSPAAPTATTWNGTIKRIDGRQAGVTLRLEETVQSTGTLALSGSWTLRGDFHETTPVSGYRLGSNWVLLTSVAGVRVRFSADLTNRRLAGEYLSQQSGAVQGSMDLLQQ